MGNYYSYERVGDKPIKLPKVFFEDVNMVEGLLMYGYVESKKWDMVADLCRLSAALPNELITVDFTHEDTNNRWRVMFLNGKFTYVKSEFPPIDLDSLVEPDFQSGRNTFDIV